MHFWNTCFEVGNFEKCNSMQHNHCEDNCISKLSGKLHNFCINEVERTKDKELDEDALPTDIEHMINGPEGYVPLVNDNSHDVPTPKDILDVGYYFDDCPRAARQSRHVTNKELPRTVLLNLVIDSHKTRPHVNMRSRNNKKLLCKFV